MSAATHTVDWSFGAQDSLEIELGDSVEWVWGGGFHSVQYASGPTAFDESTTTGQVGFSFTQTFITEGEWQAICGVHGSSMSTNIAVSAVPVPAAAWLFGSALVGLAGVKRKRPSC